VVRDVLNEPSYLPVTWRLEKRALCLCGASELRAEDSASLATRHEASAATVWDRQSRMMVHIVTTVSADTSKCTRFQFVAPLRRAGLVLFALIWENCWVLVGELWGELTADKDPGLLDVTLSGECFTTFRKIVIHPQDRVVPPVALPEVRCHLRAVELGANQKACLGSRNSTLRGPFSYGFQEPRVRECVISLAGWWV